MTVLDNDLVNTIQAERRAEANGERIGNSLRARPLRQAMGNTPRPSVWGWVRSSMPAWARLVFAR